MPIDVNNYIASQNPGLYAGPILFAQGRADTPLLSMIGGRRRPTNSEVFIIGQNYANPVAGDSVVAENVVAKQVPDFAPVGRNQGTNVTQIHSKSIARTDYSTGNTGMLQGEFNLAGQYGQPMDEMSFQRALKVLELRQDIENDFINGKYFYRDGNRSLANRTRGLYEAIQTNKFDVGGNELSWNHLNQLLISMRDHGAPTAGLVLGCDLVTATQLANEAKAEHYTIVSGVDTINGIGVTDIRTVAGVVRIVDMRYLQPGTALVLNIGALSIVEQPFHNGGFVWFPIGREGGSEVEMIQGALGLDYGYEGCHGILHNIATGYTPYKGTKVYIANPVVETTESLPEVSGVTLAGMQANVASEPVTVEFYGDPTADPTLTYQWKIGNSAAGAFADIEGATAATYTPTEEQVGKYIRVEVTATGTANGKALSNARKVAAAE